MPTARPDSASVPSGGNLEAGRKVFPAWLSGAVLFDWVTLAGTQFDQHPDAPTTQVAGMFAYSGASVARSGSELWLAGGGHADGWRNEVWSIRLAEDAPGWVRRRASTPFEDIGWLGSDVGSSHYTDGRPASRHTYYAIQFNDATGLLMFHGAHAVYGNGNGSFSTVDAFDPGTNDYLTAGTFTSNAFPAASMPSAKDWSGNVYQQSQTTRVMQKWSPSVSATGAPGVLVSWGDRGNAINEAAHAVDTSRQIMFRCGRDAISAGWFDLEDSGALTTVTLVGGSGDVAAVRSAGISLVYDEANDCFWCWPSLDTPALYRIDISGTAPTLTFTVTQQAFTGTVSNADLSGYRGYGRFSYCPELRGIVWVHRHNTPVRFLRTS